MKRRLKKGYSKSKIIIYIVLVFIILLFIFIRGENLDYSDNFQQILPEKFKLELDSLDIILIDVRIDDEVYIDGRNIQNNQIRIKYDSLFEDKIKKLDKDDIYLLYSSFGVKSVGIMEYMKKEGFKYVKDLKGGIYDWHYEK